MGLFTGWAVTVGVTVVLVVGLHHVGYDVSGAIGNTLRAVEHFLGQPLLPQ